MIFKAQSSEGFICPRCKRQFPSDQSLIVSGNSGVTKICLECGGLKPPKVELTWWVSFGRVMFFVIMWAGCIYVALWGSMWLFSKFANWLK